MIIVISVGTVSPHDVYLFNKWFWTISMTVVVGLVLFTTNLFPCGMSIDYKLLCRNINRICVWGGTLLSMLFFAVDYYQCSSIIVNNYLGGVTSFSSCVSFCLAIAFSCHKTQKSVFLLLAESVMFASLLAIQSRTSIICGLFSLIFCFGKKKGIYFFVILSFLVLLYFKSDSTIGRWFIYLQCFKMIAEKPLFGWGFNGFARYYMDWQAHYFSLHPDSKCAMLADNLHHPLNEGLLLAVNYGVVVALLVSGIVVWILMCCRNKKGLGLLLFLNVIIYCCFSYPLSFPFTWIVIVYALLLMIGNSFTFQRLSRFVSFFFILLLIVFLCILYRRYLPRREWGCAIEKSEMGMHRKSMAMYEILYPQLENDYLFLYNYACELYLQGKYEKASVVANKCNTLIADYDLCILVGDCEQALSNYDSAIDHYWHAHNMCPVRFLPLYEIWNIYKIIGKTDSAEIVRNKILEMPIKIASKETLDIIEEIKGGSLGETKDIS